MDESTKLHAQRECLQGELAAIEQAISEARPGRGAAELKQLTVGLKSCFARLRVVDAKLAEIREAAP